MMEGDGTDNNHMVRSWYDLSLFDRVLSAGLSRNSLVKLGNELMQEYLSLKESEPSVLCQLDPWINNIIINDKTGNYWF